MYICLLLKQKVWGQDQKQFIAIKRLEQMYAWLHANTFVKRNKINNNYLPFSKRMTLHLSCTYACFLPSLVKIGIVFLKSKILKMCQCIFTNTVYRFFVAPNFHFHLCTQTNYFAPYKICPETFVISFKNDGKKKFTLNSPTDFRGNWSENKKRQIFLCKLYISLELGVPLQQLKFLQNCQRIFTVAIISPCKMYSTLFTQIESPFQKNTMFQVRVKWARGSWEDNENVKSLRLQ